MPGNPPPPHDPSWSPSLPQQVARPDWSPRDYWVEPPRRIPPAPTFQAWVPAGENIVFGEEPRDASRYQALQAPFLRPVAPPLAPPIVGALVPQHPERIDWALRDYMAMQSTGAPGFQPLLPPVNGFLSPQHNARPDWTLRDYAVYQGWLASVLYVAPAALVPPPTDFIAFAELARDMTALRLAGQVNRTFPGAVPGKPLPNLLVATYPPPPYDLTAHQFVVNNTPQGSAFAGIPQVPLGGSFAAFEYEAIDMTPYIAAISLFNLPAARQPQIPPSLIPFIEWPGWQLNQYQALQDQFSALGTPPTHVYPKGLVPQFTLEALIRDLLRPWQLPQTFIIPPKPPRVFPTPQVYLEWRNWAANEYPNYQDDFSAWASGLPIAAGFRCMAVTAGLYGGLFYQPGDVFDILKASDFSDSTVNYQFAGGETVYGWMVRVAPSTPLSQAAVAQEFFVIPDPKRRFIM